MIARPILFASCLLLPKALPAQLREVERPPATPAARYESAVAAWESGDYPAALAGLDAVLTGPEAEAFRARIALLTGELYRTTDVAPDGRGVRWSPGGRFAAYESGAGLARRTVVLRLENGALARHSEIAGGLLVFAPGDGFAAYVGNDGIVRDVALADGTTRALRAEGLTIRGMAYGADGSLYVAARSIADSTGNIYAFGANGAVAMTEGPGGKGTPIPLRGGVAYTINRDRIGLRTDDGRVQSWPIVPGFGLTAAWGASEDGATLVFAGRDGAQYTLTSVAMPAGTATVVKRSDRPLASPAVSRDGRLAYQMMPREDWELFVSAADGSGERRITHEIQHDLFPVWIAPGRVLEKIGEARHRRAYLIDAATGERTRVFHNNLLRTVSHEYQWAPSPDGARLLIVADRDGNTISPERAVFLTDLTAEVTVAEVRERIRLMTAAETDLRIRGARMFAPVAAAVRAAVADVSVARIDRYAHDIAVFDSRYITRPGDRLAIDYIAAKMRSFGYEVTLQEFEPRPGVPSANVVATLRGTVNPDLVYVVGSHLDSVEGGPGADDDATGICLLLETARVLSTRPQPASIQFVFFTAEEAGLLGSREYVRRTRAAGTRVVGALNNDMIGWRNDHRLDNTIRYSNDGIRDLQHAAAIGFSRLITYDSRYYQGTDAHALFDGYGDIVGGIGSYPILGNPHYHQSHDVLETISQDLVAEVTKTTVASLMLLASSPSRLAGLRAEPAASGASATWTAAAESGVRGYRVVFGPPDDPMRASVTVTAPRATLPGAQPGWSVAVKALGQRGLESWDWARATVAEAAR